MKKILILHGPNLNMLGKRDSAHYGKISLAELEEKVQVKAKSLNFETEFYQSNHEGFLIDFLQSCDADAIIINAGALTHTSYALHDALLDKNLPCIEVHLSNIHEREAWRANSLILPACLTQISGKGLEGYFEALAFLSEKNL